MDFLATLDALGYPRENFTCDDKGVCFDLEGNEIGRNGKFDKTFAKETAKEFGDPKSTPYGPSTGNVPAGTATDDVKEFVTRPIYFRVKTLLRENNAGVDVLMQGPTVHSHVMIGEENNSWGVLITVDRYNPNTDRYFAYEKESGELVVVPIY